MPSLKVVTVLKEHPSSHDAGQIIKPSKIFTVSEIFINQEQNNYHDQADGKGSDQELDLQMKQIMINGI